MPQPDDQLTKTFSLSELIASETAARDPALAEQFNPPAHVLDNLQYLAERVLQQLRDEIAWSGRSRAVKAGARRTSIDVSKDC